MDTKELMKIANKYEENGEPDKAYIYWLEAALADDDGEAVYKLADMYLKGKYVNVDFDKSSHYFEIAYERGYNLPKWLFVFIGGHYENGGEYQKEDHEAALKWYQMATDSGVAYAYACIGSMYFEGKGVEQDYKKAFELFKQSGEKETMPLYYLGMMFEKGLYVDRNTEKAKEYYNRILNDYSDLKEYGDQHYLLAEERATNLGIDHN